MKTTFCLEAKNLNVNFGKTLALNIPSLKIEGKVFAIVGHNGSGKSTFIKTLLQILTPSSGYLKTSIEDKILIPEKDMSFAPEDGSVFEDISVEQYLKLWCDIKHKDPNYYKQNGRRYVDKLRISPLFSKLGRELSKGQKRRVQTTVSCLIEPKLLLLDEPFDGLDVVQTNLLNELINEELKEKCLIISSHRMDVIERIADIVLVLNKGEIIAQGNVSKVSETLCKQSIVISSDTRKENNSPMFEELQQRYKTCVINKIGENLIISGDEIDLSELNTFLENKTPGTFRANSVAPSLIDSMNYFLKRNL